MIGERLPRREDARLLTGRGRFVADQHPPGCLHAAFVRSTEAHARIVAIDTTGATSADGVAVVLTGKDADLLDLRIEAPSVLPGYVNTGQPPLAVDKVRYVGEPVVMIVATDRYLAEDAAELVDITYEPLPAAVDAAAARGERPHPVHAEAPDNVLVYRRFEAGDVDAALGDAATVVRRTFNTNRHAAMPIETRGAVASWDPADELLTVHCTTQSPHLHRRGLSRTLGLAEAHIRVIVGDVGGGFGPKGALYPEDVATAVATRRLGRPVSWIEDRVEHLQATMHARDHQYEIAAAFGPDGELLGMEAELVCNVGAYSNSPFTAAIEPLMAGGLLTGPYRCANFCCDTYGVFTNTTPTGAYRGVSRPATTYAMERMLDAGAATLGIDPLDIRRRNLVTPFELPYRSPTRLVHENVDYPECLERVARSIDYPTLRAEQTRLRTEGRYLGIGFAVYNELTGLGRLTSAGPGTDFKTGHEGCTIRLDPSGSVTALPGVTSQGQGHETTIAQVVASELGVPVDTVRVRIGDTGEGAFGLGAFASRQGVIGGGAAAVAARAVREKILRIAAHLLEAEPDWLTITDGNVHTADAPARGVTVAEVAAVAHYETHRLPDGEEPGLEVTRFYDPFTGTFAPGAQVAVVEVDPATGGVDVRRYVCVEDTGTIVNPMIVEGQVHGAVAQGISGALFEHVIHDADGQLVTGTLMDYLVAGPEDMPTIEIDHLEHPADNLLGVRGVGEGGTLGPYAALANAVSDALSPFGIEVNELPITPSRLFTALASADPGQP